MNKRNILSYLTGKTSNYESQIVRYFQIMIVLKIMVFFMVHRSKIYTLVALFDRNSFQNIEFNVSVGKKQLEIQNLQKCIRVKINQFIVYQRSVPVVHVSIESFDILQTLTAP